MDTAGRRLSVSPPVLAGVPTAPGSGIGPVRSHRQPGRGVVVAHDLGPEDVLVLDTDEVQAVALAAGAPLSHASILARSIGLPVVTGLGPAVLDLPPGAIVLVDGEGGTVEVDPPPHVVAAALARDQATRQRAAEARRWADEPAITQDGVTIPVLANVGSRGDALFAVREGADGVGMLRTEFAFLGRTEAPTEADQYDAYRGVAGALGDRPLIVRTLDLGADIPAWGGQPEPNPALGNRGIRFSLSQDGLLDTQLRAIARLAEERPLQVMFPMVTTVDEVRQARAVLDRVLPSGAAEVGITVEVPAAALTAEAFAPLVDFYAIGTNDLTQYALATDRSNAAVAGLADGLHPAVLRLIAEVTAAGERHGRPVEVVGELATDPVAIPVLLGLGVAMLSVRPNAVGTVKQAIRAVDLSRGRQVAEAALTAESASAVRRLAAG